MKRIAIQGGYGAFHEIAAVHYFEGEDIEIIPRNTFREMLSSLSDHKSDLGIMAIENSLAGSILPNYNLLMTTGMQIIGEIYLRINQNLVALPGTKITDLVEVYSHPMAILQCQQFFDDYPHIRLIESMDTALSARDIAEKRLINTGAISSTLAARKYGLEILAGNIETNKMNYTRFLILEESGSGISSDRVNKASVYFALAHKIGSLSKILSIFSYYEINLAKIQSMPIIGKDWEYLFFIDLEVNNYEMYKKSLEAIRPFISQLGIMGEYVKGKTIFDQ